jgi:tetratricopeptide (TPR) repeat protein
MRGTTCLLTFLTLTTLLTGQEPERLIRVPSNPSADEIRRREALTLFAIGSMQTGEERYLQALSTLESARLLDADALPLLRELARVQARLGRITEATQACRSVVARDPADYETWHELARLHEARDEMREAGEAVESALASPHLVAVPERRYVLLRLRVACHERLSERRQAIARQREVVRIFDAAREQFLENGIFNDERLKATRAENHERLGRLLQEEGDHDGALTSYRIARDEYLKLTDERERFAAIKLAWRLSDLAYQRGQHAEALRHLDEYLTYAPSEAAPYERKADLYRALGRPLEIVPMLRQAHAAQNHHRGLQMALARELGRAGELRESATLIDELIEKNPIVEVARERVLGFVERRDWQGLLDYLDAKARAGFPKEVGYDPQHEQRLKVAGACIGSVRLLKLDDQKTFRRHVAGSTNVEARHPAFLQCLSMHAAQQGDLSSARILMQAAYTASTDYHELRPAIEDGLLDSFAHARRWDDLIRLAEKLLAGKTTRELFIRLHLSRALLQRDRADDALTVLAPAIESAPFDAKIRVQCQRWEILMESGRADLARRECESALNSVLLSADLQAVRMTYSRVLDRLGEPAKSEEQLRLLLEATPDDPLVLNNLGYALADRGVKLDEAERLIRKALDEDSKRGIARQAVGQPVENGHYLDSLAWVLFRQGKKEEARQYLLRAIAMDDVGTGELWDHLGDVHASLKDTTSAAGAYEKAIALYQQEPASIRRVKLTQVKNKLQSLGVVRTGGP